MKVAIVGAGVSGLACAHELERLGIQAEIFERKNTVGEIFPHVGAVLQIINRPVDDPLAFIKERYFLELKELGIVKKIVMHAPRVTSTVKGRALGYFLRRGQDKSSVENQLLAKLKKTRINFDAVVNTQELAKQYDALVIATGGPDIPKEYGIWTPLFSAWVHGATLLGNFATDRLEMWLDTDFANSGYAYLCPFDNKSAVLALAVADIEQSELLERWQLFLAKRNINNEIVQSFTLPHVAGFVFPQQIDNIYFVGIAGGFLDPFLGFGQFHAITTGVTAARCIAERKDYIAEVQPYLTEIMHMLEFRQAINNFSNKDFDKLVKILGIPVLNQLIYNTNINVIKHSSTLVGAVGKASLKKLFGK